MRCIFMMAAVCLVPVVAVYTQEINSNLNGFMEQEQQQKMKKPMTIPSATSSFGLESSMPNSGTDTTDSSLNVVDSVPRTSVIESGGAMKMNEVIPTAGSTLDRNVQTGYSTVNTVGSASSNGRGSGRSSTLGDEPPCDDDVLTGGLKINSPVSSVLVAHDTTDSTLQTVTNSLSSVGETVTPGGDKAAYAASPAVNTATNNTANMLNTVNPDVKESAYTAGPVVNTVTSNLSNTVTSVGEKAAYTTGPVVNTVTNNMYNTVNSVGEKSTYTHSDQQHVEHGVKEGSYAADSTVHTVINNTPYVAETVAPVVKEDVYTAYPTVKTVTNNLSNTVTPGVKETAYTADSTVNTVISNTPKVADTVAKEGAYTSGVREGSYAAKTVAPVAKIATDIVAYTTTSPTATTPIPASTATILATTTAILSNYTVAQNVDSTTGVIVPSAMPPATTMSTTTGVTTTEKGSHQNNEDENESSLEASQSSADEKDSDSDSKESTSAGDNADSVDSESEDSNSEDHDTGGDSKSARKSSLSSGDTAKKPLTKAAPATKITKSEDSDSEDSETGGDSVPTRKFSLSSGDAAKKSLTTTSSAKKTTKSKDVAFVAPAAVDRPAGLRSEKTGSTSVSPPPADSAFKKKKATNDSSVSDISKSEPKKTTLRPEPSAPAQVPAPPALQVPTQKAPQVPAQAPQVPAPVAAATVSAPSIPSDSPDRESVEAQAQQAAAVSRNNNSAPSLVLAGLAGIGCVAIIAIVAFMKKPNHETDETMGPDGERISTTTAMEARNFEGSVSNDPLGTRYSSIIMITPNGDGMCIL